MESREHDLHDGGANRSGNGRGFHVEVDGHEVYAFRGVSVRMEPVALALGPLGSPPALLVGLVVLAVILLVGRVVMAVAWRLVLIALAAVVVLWVLGLLGFQTGIL